MLKWVHFTRDRGHEPLDLRFVRDKSGREVDFPIVRDGRPWVLIEAKHSATTPGAALHSFAQRLGVRHKLLVVADLPRPGTAGDVLVLDAPTFLSALPV